MLSHYANNDATPYHAVPWCIVVVYYSYFCIVLENHNLSPEEKAALIASTKSPISFFSKLGQSIAISRKRNPKVVKFLFETAELFDYCNLSIQRFLWNLT